MEMKGSGSIYLDWKKLTFLEAVNMGKIGMRKIGKRYHPAVVCMYLYKV